MTIEEINKHYKSLRQIVYSIQESWRFFGQVFRSGEENINLLNRSAGHFFYQCHRSINVAVIVRICALIERSETLGRENLSFKQLAEQIETIDEVEGKKILCKITEEEPQFNNLVTVRNRALAHFDLKTFGEHSAPHSETDAAIEALLRILDCFEDYLQPSERRWKHPPHYPPGSTGDILLQILRHRESLIAENAMLRSAQ